MFEFRSIPFQNDPLLQAIADDALTPDGARVRISSNQHAKDPAVRKVQQTLLTWRADCLPQWGADGKFGSESERAVRRFKIEELQVGPAGVVNDVGPRTVQRLDEIQAAAEASAPPQTPIVVPSVPAGPLVKCTRSRGGGVRTRV